MPKLVIFGIGKIGQVAYHHFKTDSEYDVVGFAVDRDYLPEDGLYDGLPVVAFDEVEKHFSPKEHSLFVATGYQSMNSFRAECFSQAKIKGYQTASYVSSQNKYFLPEQIGENCFVMSGEPLQPHAKIGDNCFVWTNALIGHHSTISDNCWVTSGVTIGGNTRIGRSCFLGLGATIGHEITIGAKSIIGAGALVIKDAPAESVYAQQETERFRLNSEQFLKMTNMK